MKKLTKFEKMVGYKSASVKQSTKPPETNKPIPKSSTWDRIKAGLVSAREKKQKLVKEIGWVQDFVGDSGTQMTDKLMGNPKRAKPKKEQPRTDRYMPIRKKPPPKQNLPNGSAFLRSL